MKLPANNHGMLARTCPCIHCQACSQGDVGSEVMVPRPHEGNRAPVTYNVSLKTQLVTQQLLQVGMQAPEETNVHTNAIQAVQGKWAGGGVQAWSEERAAAVSTYCGTPHGSGPVGFGHKG